MQVDAADRERIKSLFDQARRLSSEPRLRFLESACGSNSGLRACVEGLLTDFDAAGELLSDPTIAGARVAAIERPPDEALGHSIGGYRLQERIGEGGFGTVYLAEQYEPVRRRVALKIVKPGMDSRQVIARFEAERQALALMDHPNIARVLDGGATDFGSPFGPGRPYFVMELVTGIPITPFCDQQRLGLRERLALFGDVCHAVQHAHQKGIIHRDIKPNNVLVSLYDDKPVAKIIDFGIAKAIGGRLTDKTVFTELRQMIGTPAYMSPEQAGLSDLDIDTRSDIYSLGVLLYELLTGVTPFDAERLRRADFDELRRIIREEDSPRPSTRLSSLMTATGSAGVPSAADSSSRSLDPAIPRSLSRQLRGDLDWIVMKCLEKDRTRRYETASALAEDVQRHLAGEPTLAAPPSKLYRLRKLARRNRGPVAAAAVFLLLILCCTVVSTVFWQRAEREAEQARQVASFMEDTLAGVGPGVARDRDTTLLKELMDAAARRIRDGELSAAPEAELRLRLTIGQVYREIAEYELAHDMLDPAEDLLRVHSIEDAQTAETQNALAELLYDEGQGSEALVKSQTSLALCERLHAGDHPQNATARYLEVLSLRALGRHAEALPKSDTLLAMCRRLHSGDHLQTARAMIVRASLLQQVHGPALALPLYEDALAMLDRAQGSERPHPEMIECLNWLARCYAWLGQSDQALRRYETALDLSRRVYPRPHPDTANVLHVLAEALRRDGRLDEAERYAKEAVQMLRTHSQWGPKESLNGEWYLASILLDSGKGAEAIESLRAFDVVAQERFPDHPIVRVCSLGMLPLALLKHAAPGDVTEAERHLNACMAICEETVPQGRVPAWMYWNTMSMLGEVRAAQGRFTDAEPLVLDAYNGLLRNDVGMPRPEDTGIDFKRDALERILSLYVAWHGAEPDKGHDARAAQWRTKLAAHPAATQHPVFQPDAPERAPPALPTDP